MFEEDIIEGIFLDAELLEHSVGVVLVLLNEEVVFDEELVGGLEGGDETERGEGNEEDFNFGVGVKEMCEHYRHKDGCHQGYGRGDCGAFVGGIEGGEYQPREEYCQSCTHSRNFECGSSAEKFGKAPEEEGENKRPRKTQGKDGVVNDRLYWRGPEGRGFGTGGAESDDNNAAYEENIFKQ